MDSYYAYLDISYSAWTIDDTIGVAFCLAILIVLGLFLVDIVNTYRQHKALRFALHRIVDDLETADSIRQLAFTALGETATDSLERRRQVLRDLKDDLDVSAAVRAVAAQELIGLTDD